MRHERVNGRCATRKQLFHTSSRHVEASVADEEHGEATWKPHEVAQIRRKEGDASRIKSSGSCTERSHNQRQTKAEIGHGIGHG